LNMRIFVRRLLGFKGTMILRNTISTISFSLRLIPYATSINRPEGISAMVCTRNDPEWLEPSLLSIKDLVDEYVVIDSSTDETPQIIENLRKEHGLNIRMKKIPPGDLVKARNLALKESRYKWILHWDADFIAKDELIPTIRGLLETLDKRKYYLIYWPHVCLDVDLFHQHPQRPLHYEHWLFTYSPKLKYKWVKHFDSLIAPLTYYRMIIIKKPLSFHLCTVRSPIRLLYKHYWWKMRSEGLEGKISLEEYIRLKIKEEFNTMDINEAAKALVERYLRRLIRYDKNKYGDYPRILKEYVKHKYGVEL